MSDAFAEQVTGGGPPTTPEGRSITMTITLHPNNQLEVNGPLGNKVLAYGLLGAAAQQLDQMYVLNELKQAAALNGGSLSGLLKKMGRG